MFIDTIASELVDAGIQAYNWPFKSIAFYSGAVPCLRTHQSMGLS